MPFETIEDIIPVCSSGAYKKRKKKKAIASNWRPEEGIASEKELAVVSILGEGERKRKLSPEEELVSVKKKRRQSLAAKEIVLPSSLVAHAVEDEVIIGKLPWDEVVDHCFAELASSFKKMVQPKINTEEIEFRRLKEKGLEAEKKHEAEVAELREKLSRQECRVAELEVLLADQAKILADQGKTFKVLVENLLKTNSFTTFMTEINVVSNVGVRSKILTHVADKYKVPVRRSSWGWHSEADTVVSKMYAKKILEKVPHFALVEHLLTLGRAITFEEARELKVDFDESLVVLAKSEIPDSKDADKSEEEEDYTSGEEGDEEDEREEEGRNDKGGFGQEEEQGEKGRGEERNQEDAESRKKAEEEEKGEGAEGNGKEEKGREEERNQEDAESRKKAEEEKKGEVAEGNGKEKEAESDTGNITIVTPEEEEVSGLKQTEVHL